MKAEIIDGRAIADAVMTDLSAKFRVRAVPLHLAALCAGDDPGLRSFVRLKQKAAVSVGVEFSSYFFDAHDEDGAQQTLKYLADDEGVQGIFVELPLPTSWDSAALLSLLPTQKDVDVLSPTTQRMYYENHSDILPPSVVALQYVFREHTISVRGTSVAVVGAGELVGKPIAHWLKQQGARVDIIDITTSNPSAATREADIVITGTGTPGLVTADWVREGATVIDYGFGKVGDVYRGDVDFESVHKKAGLLTPVPGGMGPLVVVAVLENLISLTSRQ